jgi:hypothetical protein
MAADLFNNPSNDYVNPDLSPCAGKSDEYSFEFFSNQQVGVISGSSIIASMGLGDISQPVTGWVQQTKLLQSGEVAFIQGMTKGISKELQYFPFINPVENLTNSDLHQYYMSVDLSINYYKNFRYHQDSIHVTGDYDSGTTIENAFNMEFDTDGISVSATYDSSGLTFQSSLDGYAFNIYNVDVSLWLPDTSIVSAILPEDISSKIPAFKYPNGAMLGYVLKVTYPSTAENYQEYIEINHVPDNLVYYEPSTGDSNCYVRYFKSIDVGLSGTSCEDDVMSAADYLDYVQSNDKWEKVGVLRMWLSAVDPIESSTENLITGFYVFNPQSFPVKIDYMTIL